MIASKRRGDTHYRGCWGIGEEADVLVSNWTQFVEVRWNSDIMWQCWILNFPRRKFVVLPSTTSPTCKSFQVLFISSQCVFSFFIHVLCTHCPLCLLISSLCVNRFSLIFVGVLTPPPPFSSCSSLCMLSSVFVHIRRTHTPFASSSPGSADHWPTSICISVRTFILLHLGLLYSHTPPPFSLVSYRRSLYSHPPLQKACTLFLPDICSSYSPPPLLSLSPGSRCIRPFLPLMIK